MKSLPVTAIVKEAALVVWRKRARLFRGLLATDLGLAALDTAQSDLPLGRSMLFLTVLFGVASAGLFTLFAVTCHRIVLLDAAETPRFGIHSWSRREMRFLGWTFVGGFYLAASALLIGLLGTAAGMSPIDGAFPLPGYAAVLPGAYVSTRLAILLPATAIGERHDMQWAWNATAGNGWRLLAIVALLPWISGAVADAFEIRHYIGVNFVLHLLGYAVVAFEIAALSLSFRFLTQAATPDDRPAAGVGV